MSRRGRLLALGLGVGVLAVFAVALSLPGEPVPRYRAGGLLVRSLDGGSLPASDGERLVFVGDRAARVEIGAAEPVARLWLRVDAQGPASLEIEGARLGERVLRPDGAVDFELHLPAGRRDWLGALPSRAPLNYAVTLRRAAAGKPFTVAFRLRP